MIVCDVGFDSTGDEIADASSFGASLSNVACRQVEPRHLDELNAGRLRRSQLRLQL